VCKRRRAFLDFVIRVFDAFDPLKNSLLHSRAARGR
jgi:hypothetical protein